MDREEPFDDTETFDDDETGLWDDNQEDDDYDDYGYDYDDA